MKNSMTTTTTASTSGATTTVKITAIEKYLTFYEDGKILRRIAKGEGYISEYDLPTNVTKIYKSYFNINGKIKIDMSYPDLVIHGDIYDFMLDFCYKNKNVKIVETSCEKWSEIDYIGQDTCSVYCGN